MSLMSAALLLFLVMDPVGNVPMFLTALRKTAPTRKQKVILRELLIALVIMVVFLFAGQGMLSWLHVTRDALNAAGGVILLLIAVKMIFPTPEDNLEEPTAGDEPFVVPMAVPYTAGPSVLATEILLMSSDPSRWYVWLSALMIAWTASAIILYFSGYLERILGERVLVAVERLMGMILVLVAVQQILDGVKQFFGM